MRVLPHFLLWCAGIAKPQTQTTPAERACLARHVNGRKRAVEIGVWHGVTTSTLARAMPADGVLFAVDPFPKGRGGVSLHRIIAQHEVARVGERQVRWLRMRGDEAPPVVGDPVDFVFIDGDHSYDGLKADWLAWADRIAAGGVVALHDSRSTAARPIADAGSVRFTNDVIVRDSRFELAEAVDSLTVMRRRDDAGASGSR